MNDTLDTDLREIEAQLANLSPIQMPDDMLNRMEQAMISWETHLPVEEKIVPFNTNSSSSNSSSSAPKSSNFHLWGAAAAVALMGCVAGVFMTGDAQQHSAVVENHTSKKPSSAVAVADRMATNIMPEYSRNVTHASNEGITYAGKNEAPFKVLRIEYTEKVVTKDKDGKEVVTEKPCVEHVLVPVPVH